MAGRRARIRRLVALGKRIGYLCFAAAIVLFFVGFAVRFTPALTGAIVALMVVGCFVLPPAIVFAYGLRAAEREEREERQAREERDARRARAEGPPAEPGADARQREPETPAGNHVASGQPQPGVGPPGPGAGCGQPEDRG